MTDFGSLDDFGRRAPAEFAATALVLGGAAKREIAQRMLAYSKAIAPVGGPEDRHAGQLKASFKASIPGAPSAAATIDNDAGHAAVIDRGRRRGYTPRGSARVRKTRGMKTNKAAPMLGSKQAPRGFTRPAWDRVNDQAEQIIDAAGREAGE